MSPANVLGTRILSFAARPAPSEHAVSFDELTSGKLLIQAMSGYGKTYAIRTLLEWTADRAQQFIFDPQADFLSLREKFSDLLIVGGLNGDLPLPRDRRRIRQLCLSLVESRASVVFDFSELEVEDMQEFVGTFLTALMKMPRDPARRIITVVDEAHLLAPQGGRSAALRALKDVSARGRTRGICLVIATQRFALVDKNFIGQVNNYMIGHVTLANDIDASASALGWKASSPEARSLRSLKKGHFTSWGRRLAPKSRFRS